MATLKKAEAARINGAKSRGPVTPEGKARSARNGITHGLTAQAIVLINESRPLFEALHQAVIERFQPQDGQESLLVEAIATAQWRIRRCWGLETAIFDAEMDDMQPALDAEFPNLDEPTRLARAYKRLIQSGDPIYRLSRYEAHLTRQFQAAVRALEELRARHPPAPPEPPCQTEPTGEQAKQNETVPDAPANVIEMPAPPTGENVPAHPTTTQEEPAA
jgi:hypothetical protein